MNILDHSEMHFSKNRSRSSRNVRIFPTRFTGMTDLRDLRMAPATEKILSTDPVVAGKLRYFFASFATDERRD